MYMYKLFSITDELSEDEEKGSCAMPIFMIEPRPTLPFVKFATRDPRDRAIAHTARDMSGLPFLR